MNVLLFGILAVYIHFTMNFLSLRKFLNKLSATRLANAILLSIVLCVVIYKVFAATPNPGHPWTDIGDGLWQVTGPTSLHTYTFPDSNAGVW